VRGVTRVMVVRGVTRVMVVHGVTRVMAVLGHRGQLARRRLAVA